MDPILLAGIDRSHREQLEKNPEAIFGKGQAELDAVTVKLLK